VPIPHQPQERPAESLGSMARRENSSPDRSWALLVALCTCSTLALSIDLESKCCAEQGLMCRMNTLPVPHQPRERPAESSPSMFRREDSSPGQLVGTVEVSLVPSTRTRYLTLNAPEVRQ